MWGDQIDVRWRVGLGLIKGCFLVEIDDEPFKGFSFFDEIGACWGMGMIRDGSRKAIVEVLEMLWGPKTKNGWLDLENIFDNGSWIEVVD